MFYFGDIGTTTPTPYTQVHHDHKENVALLCPGGSFSPMPMVARRQVARRRLASLILSLLRTRRPFRLFVVVILIWYLCKSLPRAVVDRFKKDTGLEEPTGETPLAFPQGQQQSSQHFPYKLFGQPTATASKTPQILGKH